MMRSLESLAFNKIAVELWSHPDIKEAIVDFCLGDFEWWKMWADVQIKVEMNIQLLKLPEITRRQLLLVVKQIGLHIHFWLRCYKYLFVFSERSTRAFINDLCWTSKGTIDEKKTVELLLDRNALGLKDGYTFACVFCLSHRISLLWDPLYKE